MKTIELSELDRLRGLKLNIKRSASQLQGSRRSSRKGRSAEFSGYREYIPGDDMRYVDWNAYARLDKLYIKEYMEEKEGVVNIYLDTSRSMEFGEKLKSTLMAEVTEAINFVASSGRDSVYVTDLKNPGKTIRIENGPVGMRNLKKWLEATHCSGSVDLTQAIMQVAGKRGGNAVIISDFMDADFLKNGERALKFLRFLGKDIYLLHILSKEEIDIQAEGSYQFIDSEDEMNEVRVTLERGVIKNYEKELKEYLKKVGDMAAKVEGEHILCRTDEPLQKVFLQNMRKVW